MLQHQQIDKSITNWLSKISPKSSASKEVATKEDLFFFLLRIEQAAVNTGYPQDFILMRYIIAVNNLFNNSESKHA